MISPSDRMTQSPPNPASAPSASAPSSRSGRRRERASVELGALFDRLPPHSVETEMALLGSMILDPKVIGDVILTVKSPDDFYRPAHGAIFASLVELYDRHAAGDLTLLHQRLEEKGVLADIGGVEYLLQLAESVPAAVNAPYYAKVVAEKSLVRRLIGAAGEILHAAYMEGGEVRDVLDAAQRSIFDVVLQFDHEGTRSLSSLLEETLKAIESREQGHITGLATHFRELDEMTSGLQPGEMVIVAARPSMGKTSFALNVAENIALMGTPVGVFSLEMGKQQLAERLLSSRSEVDSHKLRRNMISKHDYHRIATAVGQLSEAPIFIDDTPGLSVLELRAKARRMVAKHAVKLIVVDYLQLMMGSTRESRQQEVAEISRGVKSLARELSVPVICLSQLNRAAENREDHRPRMADLRESGSIEQDADVVMMLHREDYYNQSKPDFEPTNIAELIIAKQRNGPTGTVRLTWVGSSMKFKDFSPMMPPVESMRPSRPAYSPAAPPRASAAPPADLDDGIPI
ncbi:MAG: replicative DNA helicase [Phycisphaerales bacterium]|nr:replicative DNA helicase [Phycisphaerales bacterium]